MRGLGKHVLRAETDALGLDDADSAAGTEDVVGRAVIGGVFLNDLAGGHFQVGGQGLGPMADDADRRSTDESQLPTLRRQAN